MTDSRDKNGSDGRRFMTTQWTHVLSARGESTEAKESLKVLCDRYYTPVYTFVQNYTHRDQNAQDWTHAFFAKLLEGRSLDSVLQSKGKFRSYLLGAVKHFLADEWAKQLAEKRGGAIVHLALDASHDSIWHPRVENEERLDACFDRQWAMSILQMSLEDLESELGQSQSTRFELLRPWLSGDPIEHSHAAIGAKLGLSAETVKATIHRWRKRFREIVKSHIASTLSNASSVEEELDYLIRVLASEG
jgi:RNA polymerase sigma factor (sigma-70 family)